MKINIITPYRPLSNGGNMLSSPNVPLYQNEGGKWKNPRGIWENLCPADFISDDDLPKRCGLDRTFFFLNKNSYYKHQYVVAIDSDVYPNTNFLKEYDNVRIVKSNFVVPENADRPSWWRASAANIAAFNTIPDDEWLCYGYIVDAICAKDWDKYLVEAMQQYGDNCVYVPMFVEVHDVYAGYVLRGQEITTENIWKTWREKICCHALSLPLPSDRAFVTEEDFNQFIKIANQANQTIKIEEPGKREWGNYTVMIMKAKYAKMCMDLKGNDFDTTFDNNLGGRANLRKVVVTKSFVLHPDRCEFRCGGNS